MQSCTTPTSPGERAPSEVSERPFSVLYVLYWLSICHKNTFSKQVILKIHLEINMYIFL